MPFIVFRPDTDVEVVKRFQVSDGLGNFEYVWQGWFPLKQPDRVYPVQILPNEILINLKPVIS